MNPLDPDYDPKGYRRGSEKGGRGEAPNLEKMIGARYAEVPTDADYKMAAYGVGLEPDQVPRQATYANLIVWVHSMHALRGSKEHFAELGDRVSPKPSRSQGADGSGSSRRSNARASKSEADKWFGNLEGSSDDGSEDDDADLL